MDAQNQLLKWSSAEDYLEFDDNGATNIYSLPMGDYQGEDERPTNLFYGKNRNIEFFIVGENIYNYNGDLIGNFGELVFNDANEFESFGEIGIIPYPDHCGQYFIIATDLLGDDKGYATKVYAFTLDMNEIQGSGIEGKIVAFEGLTEDFGLGKAAAWAQIAITPERPDGSFFLYIYEENLISKFNIDNTGIWKDLNFSYGSWYPNCIGGYLSQTILGEGEIRESANGYELAFITCDEAISIFSLDANGYYNGGPDNPREFSRENSGGVQRFSGLEFSVNGNYLYFTREDESSSGAKYLDLTQPILSEASVTNAPTNESFGKSFIERSTDGKLYYAAENKFATLDNSNNPSSSWNSNAISITNPGVTPFTYDGEYFLLPDQIDQENYDNITINTTDAISYTVSTGNTEVWEPGNNPFNSLDGNVYIKNELIIEAGAQLEIRNMTVHFAKDGKIVVHNGIFNYFSSNVDGGRLTLTGTTCRYGKKCSEVQEEEMWSGIEVQGLFPFGFMINGLNGKLVVREQSLIEEAYYAVVSGGMSNGKPDGTKGGGVINITESTLKNNEYGVFASNSDYVLMDFKIISTTFLNDQELNDPQVKPRNFITLKNILGAEMKDIVFDEQRTGLNLANWRGNGIIARNASFSVSNSEFRNLNYGVRTTSTNKSYNSRIIENVFTNTYKGVFARAANNIVCNSNEITLNSDYYTPWGIFFTDCSNFEMQRNKISYTGVNEIYALGIIIQRSGSVDYNRISRNSFNDLYISTWALDDNGGGEEKGLGLEMLCGSYTNNTIDFYVPKGSMIKPKQGNCNEKRPAGNSFSHSCAPGQYPAESDYWMGTGSNIPSVIEYEHADNPAETPECYTTAKINTDKCIDILQTNCEGEQYHGIITGMSFGEMDSIYDTANQNYLNASDSSSKAFYLGEKYWLADRIATAYLFADTISGNVDSAIAWYERDQRYMKMVPLLIRSERFSEAESYIDSVEAAYGLSSDYADYYQLLITMRQDTLYPKDLDSIQKAMLHGFASDTNSEVQALSKNMLEMAEGLTYGESLDIPTDSSAKWGGKLSNDTEVHIYPNPVESGLFVKLGEWKAEKVDLTIYDMKGSMVIKVQDIDNDGWYSLDVSALEKGMYILKIRDSGRRERLTVKFTKQ